jgi:CRISPR-associated endonuclease Cas2
MYKFGVIIAYDCKLNKVRSNIVKICKDYGLSRIEYSVFIGALGSTEYNNILDEFKTMGFKTPFIIFVQRISIEDIKSFDIIKYQSEKLRKYHTNNNSNVI